MELTREQELANAIYTAKTIAKREIIGAINDHIILSSEYLKLFNIRMDYQSKLKSLESDKRTSRTIFQFQQEKNKLQSNIAELYDTEIDLLSAIWENSSKIQYDNISIKDSTIYDPSSAIVENMLRDLLEKNNYNIRAVVSLLDKTINSNTNWYWISKFNDYREDKNSPIIIKLSRNQLYAHYRSILGGIHDEYVILNSHKLNHEQESKSVKQTVHQKASEIYKKTTPNAQIDIVTDVFSEYFNLPYHTIFIDYESIHSFVKSIMNNQEVKSQQTAITSYLSIEKQRRCFLNYLITFSTYHEEFMTIDKITFITNLSNIMAAHKRWKTRTIEKYYYEQISSECGFKDMAREYYKELKTLKSKFQHKVNRDFIDLIINDK